MTSPKLTKDQIQKLGLSTLGLVVLTYVYFNYFLAPLSKSRVSMQRSITELQSKLTASKSEIPKAASLEKQAGTATVRFDALQALCPEGAPIAWFPPRMKLFFANQQIDKATARPDTNAPFKQPELANWTRYFWQIDLPQTDFVAAGNAIAELENGEPLLSIARVTVRPTPDDPQYQQVSLSVNNAILKR